MTNSCGGFFYAAIPYFYAMILAAPGDLNSTPKRIISLVPSQTELLYSLGLEEETIAITKFCIHPKNWFKEKTRIGGTKNVQIDKIKALKPDLIIANKEENVKEQVEMLAKDHPVWVTDVNDLTDAYQMISDIGILTNKKTTAEALVQQIKIEFDALFKGSPATKTISVIYLIWKDPYMTIGGDTFISAMMEAAGLINVFNNQKRYPEITIEQLAASDCQLVLLSSEPYPFKQKHIEELEKQMPGKKIILADGEMFSWYGSRLLLAAPYLKQLRNAIF